MLIAISFLQMQIYFTKSVSLTQDYYKSHVFESSKLYRKKVWWGPGIFEAGYPIASGHEPASHANKVPGGIGCGPGQAAFVQLRAL